MRRAALAPIAVTAMAVVHAPAPAGAALRQFTLRNGPSTAPGVADEGQTARVADPFELADVNDRAQAGGGDDAQTRSRRICKGTGARSDGRALVDGRHGSPTWGKPLVISVVPVGPIRVGRPYQPVVKVTQSEHQQISNKSR